MKLKMKSLFMVGVVVATMMMVSVCAPIEEEEERGIFTEINLDSLPIVYGASMDLGDIDGDGDIDLILSGNATGTGSNFFIKIYQNDGSGFFTEINSGSLAYGSVKLGDVNGNTNLDLIIIGNNVSRIYTNNGSGGFIEIDTNSLIGVSSSSIVLGDIDTNGTLDLILIGKNNSNVEVSKIYTNNGSGGFTEINSSSLTGVYYGSIDLGDIDGDGDLDLILTGGFDYTNTVSKIYANNGSGGFTEINASSLSPVHGGSIKLGDIDGDGDIDLVLTGDFYTGNNTYKGISKIYANNGSGSFTEINSGSLMGVRDGSLDLGDVDNDGDLDLILSSAPSSETRTILYQNNGSGSFTTMPFVSEYDSGMVRFGNIDSDNYLDLIMITERPEIYRNNTK